VVVCFIDIGELLIISVDRTFMSVSS